MGTLLSVNQLWPACTITYSNLPTEAFRLVERTLKFTSLHRRPYQSDHSTSVVYSILTPSTNQQSYTLCFIMFVPRFTSAKLKAQLKITEAQPVSLTVISLYSESRREIKVGGPIIEGDKGGGTYYRGR